jgi:hypothetical protein
MRPLPIVGPSVNPHHPVPRSYCGKETVRTFRICHNKANLVFSELQLAHYYHTRERLLESTEIHKFVS